VPVRLIGHHVQVSHDERGPVGALSLASSDDTWPTAYTGMNRNSGDLEVVVGAGDEGEVVGFAAACVNIALPSRHLAVHQPFRLLARPVGERRGRDAGGRARPRYGLTSRRLNPKARHGRRPQAVILPASTGRH
jgi:hypothetical protein